MAKSKRKAKKMAAKAAAPRKSRAKTAAPAEVGPAGRDLKELEHPAKSGDYQYWVQGEGLLKIEEMLKQGLFDKQIAEAIGVTPQTLCNWKNRFELLNFIWKKARNIALKEVENATYKSACGYYVTEQIIDSTGKKRAVKRWIPGSTGDRALLLKNWAPDEYKDKREMTVDGAVPVVLSGDDEIPE
jgi:hypothetical protein